MPVAKQPAPHEAGLGDDAALHPAPGVGHVHGRQVGTAHYFISLVSLALVALTIWSDPGRYRFIL